MPITASEVQTFFHRVFHRVFHRHLYPLTASWSSHIVSQGDMLLLAVNWCFTCYFTCVIQFQYNSKIISKLSHNSSQGWIMLNFFAEISFSFTGYFTGCFTSWKSSHGFHMDFTYFSQGGTNFRRVLISVKSAKKFPAKNITTNIFPAKIYVKLNSLYLVGDTMHQLIMRSLLIDQKNNQSPQML